jgi:hypothetical protein
MRATQIALALAALAMPAWGQAGNAVVEATYSNHGISPSQWTLTLHPDGSGHFHSEQGSVPVAGQQTADAPNVDRDIQVSGAFARHVFAVASHHKWFNTDCESHLKVAFQGWKKLSYKGPDGQGTCVFNYSKDREIQSLGDSLVAVAGTIVEGARLEMLLQHDRLGLDSETEYLVEAVGDGRAQQIGTIREILERLAEDDGVMDRVRKRVRILLAKEGDNGPQTRF